jgi:aminopeptidase-like protein
LLTTHVCHPSLANDNLTGIAMLCGLGELLMQSPPRYFTHRLLFIPGTIGSLTWLAQHRDEAHRVRHGIVMTGVGDNGPPTWKRTRNGDDPVDEAMLHVLQSSGDHRVLEYYPYGYDERQFSSPGFAMSVGRFGRSVHGEYPEYHTSADSLDFVHDASMANSLVLLAEVLDVLDGNETFVNLAPYGEPQLGRRGLYRAIGGAVDRRSAEMAVLWVLNQSDGNHSLLDIAQRSSIAFRSVRDAADALLSAGLLEPAK